jgi:methylsterol monooxygenase
MPYFYYTHRILHNILWKYHSKHHELITSVAVGTLNSSVFENIVSNVLPIAVMPFIVNMSYITAVIWTIAATFSAVTAHCGFTLLNFLTRFHSVHHLNRTCNYGVLGLADYIHGTYTP